MQFFLSCPPRFRVHVTTYCRGVVRNQLNAEIFIKIPVSDVWLGSEYVSAIKKVQGLRYIFYIFVTCDVKNAFYKESKSHWHLKGYTKK